MADQHEGIEVQKTTPRVMAQAAGIFTSLEARPEESPEQHAAAVNPRPDSANLGREVGATTEKGNLSNVFYVK